jgi:hypothetical protein
MIESAHVRAREGGEMSQERGRELQGNRERV